MKKKRKTPENYFQVSNIKLLRVMRLSLLFLWISLFQLSANGFSQGVKLTLKFHNTPVGKVIDEIEKQSDYAINFSSKYVDVNRIVDVDLQNAEVGDVLKLLFKNTNVGYQIKENQILLFDKSIQQTTKIIHGVVKDIGGLPIPGVSVMIKGTNLGTITGNDGSYNLELTDDAKALIFSFIGMKTVEVILTGQSVIDITMVEDIAGLDEVVVVGYGTQKKVNLTGSVASIKGDDLAKRTVSDTRLALQGAATGVIVIDRGGVPGAESVELKIRGNTSLSAGSNPLVLVDGVEMAIKEVNPSDIESISVLKDAASCAIYGARAANGVVLITTKRGTEGDFKVRYDAYLGWQTPATLPETVGAEDYLRLVNEARVNAGLNPKYSEEYIQKTVSGDDSINYPYTNLFEQLFNTAPMNNHSVVLSGGTEKLRLALSVNYLDQDGMMKNVNTKRYGMRLNTDFVINDHLKMRADINFNRRDNVRPSRLSEAISNIVGSSPVIVPKYPNGLYGLNQDNKSALACLEVGGRNEAEYETLNAKGGFDFLIVNGLKFISDFSYKSINNRNYNFLSEYKFYDPFNETRLVTQWYPSELSDSRWMSRETNFKSMLNYERQFENHALTGLAGFEAIETNSNYLWGARKNIYSKDYAELNTGGADSKDNSGYREDWALASYFARVNYAFKQKYLLETNFRYDGSSRFAKGNKWGFFPSFSAGWRVSEEGFMKNLLFVENLKFRASWGQLGNQDIGFYRFTSPVYPGYDYNFNDKSVNGYSQWYYANTDVTWETTEITDFGMDLSLWNGMIGLTADYFIKNTHDVLMTLPISYMVGLGASESNAGSIRNKGWEISLAHKNKIGELDYNLNVSISDVRNEVISLAGTEATISGWTILKEGEPIWALFGYKSDGLFQSQEEINNHPTQPNHSLLRPGDIKLVDINNDGEINDDDRTVIGSTLPRYTSSMDVYMSYKGFDLSALFQGVFKAENYFYGAPNEGANYENFTSKRVLDRWTPENPNASFPRLHAASNKNNYLYNDFWIRDASYIRLKNLQIGYTLPKRIIERVNIDKLRVYVGGTNLFTITDVESGLDPETYQGRPNYYPPVSTYLIGLQVNF